MEFSIYPVGCKKNKEKEKKEALLTHQKFHNTDSKALRHQNWSYCIWWWEQLYSAWLSLMFWAHKEWVMDSRGIHNTSHSPLEPQVLILVRSHVKTCLVASHSFHLTWSGNHWTTCCNWEFNEDRTWTEDHLLHLKSGIKCIGNT